MLASAAAANWKRGSSAVDSETAHACQGRRPRTARDENTKDDLAGQHASPGRDEKLQDVLSTAKERLTALSTYQVNITRSRACRRR